MKEEALDKFELRKDKEIIDKVSSKIFQIILKKKFQ
jgi:hypothetical protein